jgi:hypothetical protein
MITTTEKTQLFPEIGRGAGEPAQAFRGHAHQGAMSDLAITIHEAKSKIA